jgi:hypothetical protein
VSQRPLSRLLLLCPLLLGLGGCASLAPVAVGYRPAGPECGVLFVADGAGGFLATSDALKEAVAEEGLPLRVEVFSWTHGFGRILADQLHSSHSRARGRELAAQVLALRQCRPDLAIYLLGHSAGSAVVLEAASVLPPGTLDRVVLLAPSVSTDYDLRPALRSVRGSVEVFSSQRDLIYLGLGTALLGTADGRWCTKAAGRVGFRPQLICPGDEALYERLHEHPWGPYLDWSGNHGGHYGAYQSEYLHRFVLPLLTPPRPALSGEPGASTTGGCSGR